jgi:hypothetical protein
MLMLKLKNKYGKNRMIHAENELSETDLDDLMGLAR